jgi:hypothetical protein
MAAPAKAKQAPARSPFAPGLATGLAVAAAALAALASGIGLGTRLNGMGMLKQGFGAPAEQLPGVRHVFLLMLEVRACVRELGSSERVCASPRGGGVPDSAGAM